MNRTNRFSRLAAPKWGALLLVAALPQTAAHAQATYQILDLGTLGGTYGSGQGINNAGQVTGYFDTTINYSRHAFLYDSTGTHDLGTLGGTNSVGYAINDSGQVVGYSNLSGNDGSHAFLYDSTGMHDLGTLGGSVSGGVGINDSGQVAGYSLTRGNVAFHAFLYDSTGMHDLGTLGGPTSRGIGINASGQVTGYSDITGDAVSHAILYDSTGMHDLGTLGGNYSEGIGINASGQVVGYSTTASGVYDAFLYKNGTMTDLNTLIPANSGWHLLEADGINDKGWITGSGTINGNKHAYILRPVAVPEPSALALLFGSGLSLGWRLRRRRGVK